MMKLTTFLFFLPSFAAAAAGALRHSRELQSVEVSWFVPGDDSELYEPITVEAGTTITFNWNGNHNVFIHPDGGCSENEAIEVGRSTGASYTTLDSDVGTSLTFACDVGFHCEAGQIVEVNVVAASTSSTPVVMTDDFDIAWFVPQDDSQLYEPLTVEAGVAITFNWNGNHNVFIHPDGGCSENEAIEVGQSTGASYTTLDSDVGTTLTFACDVGFHCEAGQIVEVTVVEAEPPTLGFCFSGNVIVSTLEAGEIRMDQLRVGQHILSDEGDYERVYSFGHRDETLKGDFLQFLPSKLELSAGHMVFVEGRAIPASMVKVGDVIEGGSAVTSIKRVQHVGVYAPYTPSGTIWVNHVKTSNYVSLHGSENLEIGSWEIPITHQWLAQAFQFPHRFWCHWMGFVDNSHEVGGMSIWSATAYRAYLCFVELPPLLALLLTIPVAMVLGLLTSIEQSPCYMISALVAIASTIYTIRRRHTGKAV